MSDDGTASLAAVRLCRDVIRLLGEDAAGYDVDAIVRDLQALYGADGRTLGELHPDDYWVIFEKHDRLAGAVKPCNRLVVLYEWPGLPPGSAGGGGNRCSDSMITGSGAERRPARIAQLRCHRCPGEG